MNQSTAFVHQSMHLLQMWRVIMLLGFFCLAGQPLHAQEELLKKEAAELFDKGDFAAAMPKYSQLLANYPKDPNYNYRFGVCMLYGNADKARSLQYLEFASKSPDAETDVWFYLGRAYHLNYRFDDAIRAYSKYRELAGERKSEKLQVNNQIAMCRTGKKLLRAITDIEVLEKKELSRADFFRSYDLSGYSGQLLVKPDEFKTALDKKNKETSIIFLSGEKNELYYSSYGENEENGKDIYVVRKLPNGSWSKAQNVGYPINTEYDEDYPFLHPNGKVLYFSSKGHSSMGGYDIFRAELNEETNTWLKPVNLDFAINTPDDDILYITDFEEKTAYFASARNSPDGQMTVYHVSIERKPVEYCLIKGNFLAMQDQPSRSARIIVKNLETDEMVGIFKSNEQTGDYLLNLPNGGKFQFTVEKNGMETQDELVLVPPQYQIKPVRQEMGYKEMSGKMELYVITYFDDDTAGLSPDFLRDKAKLDINAGQSREATDLSAANTVNKDPGGNENTQNSTAQNTTQSNSASGNNNSGEPKAVTNAELVNIAFEDAATAKTEAAEKKQQADRALAYAGELNELTREKQKEADEAKAAGNNADADRLQAEANALAIQTVAAATQAEAIGRDAGVKTREADLAQQYAQQLDAAVKSKKPGEIEKLENEQQQLELLSETRSEADATLSNLQSNAETKRAEADKATQQVNDLKEEIDLQKAQADKLRADAKNERDKDIRKGLEEQALGIDEDIALLNDDLKRAQAKAEQLTGESNFAAQQLAGASQTSTQSQNNNYTATVPDAAAREQLMTDVRGYERKVTEAGNTLVVKNGNNTQQNTASTSENTTASTGENTTTSTGENITTSTGENTNENSRAALVEAETQYTDALTAADTLADAQAVAARKLELDTKRSEELKTAIAEKREAAKKETDKTTKAGLLSEADELEQKLKTVQQNTGQHEKELNTARSVQAVVQTAAAPIDNSFGKQLQNVSGETVTEKAGNEAEIYTDWAAALDNEAAKIEKQAATQRKPEQKEQNLAAAAALRKQAGEKRTLAENATAAALAASTADSSANAQTQNTQTTSGIAASSEVQLSNAAAQQQMQARTATLASADALRNTRDSLNTAAAAAPAGTERDRLQREATAVQRQLWTRETEAAQHLGQANNAQYNDNAARIEALKNAAAGNNSTDVEAAGMLAGEAAQLLQRAATERQAATAAANDPYTRTENLNAAAEHEQQAILKQQQALQRYQAAGITPASTNTSVTQNNVPENTTTQTQTATPAEVVATIATPYNAQLAQAAGIQEPAARARREAEIYDQWAEELDNSIADKQAKLNAATSAAARSALQNEINALQTELDTRQAQAAASTTRAQELETQNTSANTQTTTNPQGNETTTSGTQTTANETISTQNSAVADSPEAKLGAPYAAQLSQTQSIADPAARARREAEIYDNWAGTLDSALTAKQEALKTASGSERRILNDDITALQSELDKRQSQAAEAVTRAQQLEAQNLQTTVENTTSTNPENTTGITTSLPENNTTAPNNSTAQTTQTSVNNTGDEGDPKIVGVVINPATGEPFKEDELEVVRNSEAYRSYTELATEADEAVVETASQRRQAAKYEASGNVHVEEAQRFVDLASNENDAVKRQQYFDQATRENQLAKEDFAKRDSVNELADNTDASARSKRNEAELFLQEVDKTSYEQIKAVTKAEKVGNPELPSLTASTGENTQATGNTPPNTQTSTNTPENTAGSNTTSGNTTAGNTTSNNTTANNTGSASTTASNTPPVNNNTPASAEFRISPGIRNNLASIPINPPLPEGLVFKVQVGAFRNPIPAGTFNGFSPLTGETTPQGLTRYMAGQFNQFTTANSAKQQIRNLGYRDAFVVAFYNGKRITLAEALRLSGESVSAEVLADAAGSRGTAGSNNAGNSASTNTTTANTNTAAAGNNTAPANAAPARDVAGVSGLFYTVQVGVFSQPVPAARLYNLNGLNAERMPNGNIRYSAGVYNNIGNAVAGKNNAVSAGISDAFVTAYYNGRRISLAEARSLEAQGTVPVNGNTTAPAQNITPQNTTSQNAAPASTAAASVPFSTQVSSSTPVNDSGIVFTVQLGAFREQVPVSVANSFLQFAGRGVRHYVNPDNGFTVFMTSPVTTYDVAAAIREECVQKGISDAFVVAWKNGKRISVTQARNGG
jgi:epidermal growth factor receptor substrate 15